MAVMAVECGWSGGGAGASWRRSGRGVGGGDEPAGAAGQWRRCICGGCWSRVQRKSLEPMVVRLGGDADYQSMQQFLADSPWDPALVVQAVAERVAPEIDVEAWVLDDTGFPKDGKARRGSSVSTRGRWGRSVTVRSGSRCTRSARAGRCRWAGRCICPRTGAMTLSGGGRRRSPRRSCSRPSRELGVELVERAAELGGSAGAGAG